MTVLVVCLAISMVVAIYRLATTPTEILGDGYRGYNSLPSNQR